MHINPLLTPLFRSCFILQLIFKQFEPETQPWRMRNNLALLLQTPLDPFVCTERGSGKWKEDEGETEAGGVLEACHAHSVVALITLFHTINFVAH